MFVIDLSKKFRTNNTKFREGCGEVLQLSLIHGEVVVQNSTTARCCLTQSGLAHGGDQKVATHQDNSGTAVSAALTVLISASGLSGGCAARIKVGFCFTVMLYLRTKVTEFTYGRLVALINWVDL
jgi:hypothetical protein